MSNSTVNTRIAIFLPGYKLYGQENALINLALTLREADRRVVFLIHDGWGRDHVAPTLQRFGFEYAALPLGTIWSPRLLASKPKLALGNMVSLLRTAELLTHFFEQLRITHVITSNISFSVYLLRALKRAGITVIFRHGDEPMSSSTLQRHFSRAVFSRTDIHVANCRFLARSLTKFDPRIAARVIYNFPVSQYQSRKTLHRDWLPAERRLVYVGQLSPHKGVDLIVEAFDRLAAHYPALHLDLVGSPPGVTDWSESPTTRKVQYLAAKWSGRVRQLGQLSDPAEIFDQGTIHLCPSIWDDPSPNTIFEAKLHGLPTVAFPRGGIPELICHERDGFLCAGESADALVTGIRYFLDAPERIATAGASARQSLSDKFKYERYRDDWLAVLGRPAASGTCTTKARNSCA